MRSRVRHTAVAALFVAVMVVPSACSSEDPAGASTVDQSVVVVGSPDAAHTVAIYIDPQCSWCGKFEAAQGDALNEALASKKIKIEYTLASFLDRNGGTSSAQAVNALRAAAGSEHFLEYLSAMMSDMLAGANDGYSTDYLLATAEKFDGLKTTEFEEAVKNMSHQDFVDSAQEWFVSSGVGGTPTVFVDGTQIDTESDELYDVPGAITKYLDGAATSTP